MLLNEVFIYFFVFHSSRHHGVGEEQHIFPYKLHGVLCVCMFFFCSLQSSIPLFCSFNLLHFFSLIHLLLLSYKHSNGAFCSVLLFAGVSKMRVDEFECVCICKLHLQFGALVFVKTAFACLPGSLLYRYAIFFFVIRLFFAILVICRYFFLFARSFLLQCLFSFSACVHNLAACHYSLQRSKQDKLVATQCIAYIRDVFFVHAVGDFYLCCCCCFVINIKQRKKKKIKHVSHMVVLTSQYWLCFTACVQGCLVCKCERVKWPPYLR